jgi:uncharacterized YccA/Bax inhibitor family protein
MSYQEKRIGVSVVSGFLILVSYCIYGVTKYQSVGEGLLTNLHFWATTMLVTIGLGIAVMMVIQLVLHIYLAISNEVKKEISKKIACGETCSNKVMSCDDLDIIDKEDEMDKLIALQASKYSFGVIGFGFVVSLVSLYYQLPPAVMLNINFVSFMLASLIEGLLQLRFYRSGIQHG